jgi:hypothetical protein
MERALVIAVAALAAAGATVAEGKVASGRFAGATSKHDPVGFKVDGRGKLYAFYFEGVRLKCTDGDQFDTPTGSDRVQTDDSDRLTITRSRRFAFSVRSETFGNGYNVAGRFNRRGRKATGTLRVFANFDTQNNADPNGSVHCSSGTLTFSATRRR